MSYESELNREINAELDRLQEAKLEWRAQFVAHSICTRHVDGLVDGDHKDFWRHCGYEKVRDAVRRRINKRAGDKRQSEIEDLQYRLPGYDHVHEYYVVKRNGDDIGVHVNNLTDVEIDQKSELYRDFGRSNFSHADELQRFKRERSARSAA